MGADLFFLKGVTYLFRYLELVKLTSPTSQNVVHVLKAVFARHSIPSQLRTDNGPQFASAEMESFSKAYGFEHTTSSPHYPQSNGQVDWTVQTVKDLQSDDMYLALPVYRSMPLQRCNRSPANLCMGRKLRTNFLKVPSALLKMNFDQRHHVATLPDI